MSTTINLEQTVKMALRERLRTVHERMATTGRFADTLERAFGRGRLGVEQIALLGEKKQDLAEYEEEAGEIERLLDSTLEITVKDA